jgi:hypothetical protein
METEAKDKGAAVERAEGQVRGLWSDDVPIAAAASNVSRVRSCKGEKQARRRQREQLSITLPDVQQPQERQGTGSIRIPDGSGAGNAQDKERVIRYCSNCRRDVDAVEIAEAFTVERHTLCGQIVTPF